MPSSIAILWALGYFQNKPVIESSSYAIVSKKISVPSPKF